MVREAPTVEVLDVNTIRKTGMTLMVAILMLVPLGTALAQDETVPVTFGWAACPPIDDEGKVVALAVRYEVFLQKGGTEEVLVGNVEADTTFTLDVERGVVQRVRVVGYDSLDRPSPASEWSDPIYYDAERSSPGQPVAPPPGEPTLGPNYPNPFNPETRIAYGVPEDTPAGTRMALEIFNLRGQRIRTFEVDPSPGWHEVTWNGLDDRGQTQSTGTYITRYVCGDRVDVGKMTMVK